jgi:hypothetical protein
MTTPDDTQVEPFFCYSHHDRDLRHRLERYPAMLAHGRDLGVARPRDWLALTSL